MPDTATVPAALLSPVVYTDTQGKIKAALVIGTPESTDGRIVEGQVSVLVFNPIHGNSYMRFARLDADGTFHNAAQEAAQDDDQDDDLQDDDE